jgi:hypothetical protein
MARRDKGSNHEPSSGELQAIENLMGLLQDMFRPLPGSGERDSAPAVTPLRIAGARGRVRRELQPVTAPPDLSHLQNRAPVAPPRVPPVDAGATPSTHDVLASLGLLVAMRSRSASMAQLTAQDTRALDVLQTVVQQWLAGQSSNAAATGAGRPSVSEYYSRLSDHLQRLGADRSAADASHEDTGPFLSE